MSINVSVNVAFDLVRRAALLFYQGTGVVLDPLDDLTHQNAGFIDELDPDPESDIRYWANQLMFFVRTVHAIFNQELLTQDLLENE